MKVKTELRSVGMVGMLVAMGLTGGCHSSEPLDQKQATETAAANAETAIQQTGKALSFIVEDNGTLKTVSSATAATNTVMSNPAASMAGRVATAAVTAMPRPMLRALVGPTVSAEMTGTAMPSVMTSDEKFDQAASEVRKLMEQRLFVDSNLEGNDGTTATYLLKPDPTCRPLPADDAPAGTTPDIDAHCADDLTKVAVRIAVTRDGDGSRMTVEIGPAHLELVAVIVHSDLLAAEVDLPMAKAATDYIDAQLGSDAPASTFDRLTGKLRFSLQRVADQKVTVAFSILQAVDVAETNSSEIITAVADPAYALTGDGVNKAATLQVGMGTTEIDGKWDPQGTAAPNRDEAIMSAGSYGTYALDENAKKITLTNVGFGEEKINVRGTTIVDLNLNPSSMRRLSGTVNVNADDTVHVEVTPEFTFGLAYDYQSIASELSSPPSAATLHDTYGFSLTNGGATSAFDTVKASGTFTGGVKVAAGTLTVTAASAPSATVTVPAGQCLSSPAAAPAGTNPVLGALLVGDCP
jgi:hypothetical protein